jgi:4-hydroxy-tetrahydrodipicolinate synthase
MSPKVARRRAKTGCLSGDYPRHIYPYYIKKERLMIDKNVDRKYDRLYVALVTPLNQKGQIHERELRKHLRYFNQPKFVEAGGAVIINPEAGEAFYLTHKEKIRNIEIALEECGGKVPVFTGVIDLTTEDCVKVAKDAKSAGVDGLFLLPPMGSGDVTTAWDCDKYPEVYIDLAKAEVEATDLPALVHPTGPFTAAWGVGMPLKATLQMCKEVPNIVGWKMTYNYNAHIRVAKGLRTLDRHVAVLGAPGDVFNEALASEYFDGTVTGCFNYAMEAMIDHIAAWRRKDIDEARRIWHSGLSNLQDYVFSEYSRLHVRYKIATWLRGLISDPIMRPPQPQPRKEEIETLRNLLKKTGLSVIDKKEADALSDKLPR